MMILDPELRATFRTPDPFEEIMGIGGKVYREMDGRRTVRFERGGRSYFAKIHTGVGWREILKNLVQLRLPVLSARNEWRAIHRLEELGIPTMRIAGYGVRGWNPARLRSFIVTEDLGSTVSLEDLCRDWRSHPPRIADKRRLIDQLANTARRLHENGMNHRDFYLCHFLLDMSRGELSEALQEARIYLIDLHRMQLRRATPRRWMVKDLAGLYFSSLDAGLTRHDCLRFIRQYRNRPLRRILQHERLFWRDVERRAIRLYQSFHGAPPRLPVRAS